MNLLFLTVVAAMTSFSAFAQLPDLKEGYKFNYSECYPPQKKKDPITCVLTNRSYYIDGSFSLVSEYKKTYPLNPRMNSSSRSTVKIKELSLDHRIEKSTESYKDSSLTVHELWQLKMETDSHDLDVKGESNSEILGPDTDYGYLITLTFPTEEAAEAAWAQIREIRYLVK